MRAQMSSSSVDVEVDAAPSEDTARVLEEMRSQYEAITEKNRRDMEIWYKGKVREEHRPGELFMQIDTYTHSSIYIYVVVTPL